MFDWTDTVTVETINFTRNIHYMKFQHGNGSTGFMLLSNLWQQILEEWNTTAYDSLQQKISYMSHANLLPEQFMNRTSETDDAFTKLEKLIPKLENFDTALNQYTYFDKLVYRIIEQFVVLQQNRMNTAAYMCSWTGHGAVQFAKKLKDLKSLLQQNPSSMLRRETASLSHIFAHNLGFRPISNSDKNHCRSLQRRLCESMLSNLPELEGEMQKFIASFNIPNAELFLRIIRCNNMLALQELARQFFAGQMKEPLDKILKQMPACTESELRWLFRHILLNVYWMIPSGSQSKPRRRARSETPRTALAERSDFERELDALLSAAASTSYASSSHALPWASPAATSASSKTSSTASSRTSSTPSSPMSQRADEDELGRNCVHAERLWQLPSCRITLWTAGGGQDTGVGGRAGAPYADIVRWRKLPS